MFAFPAVCDAVLLAKRRAHYYYMLLLVLRFGNYPEHIFGIFDLAQMRVGDAGRWGGERVGDGVDAGEYGWVDHTGWIQGHRNLW